MIILILFAFLAGVVTILSPCILPILPVILSGSVSGGKRKPFGIVTGFVLSFTFFTLFLATIVSATGLSATFVRSLAVVVIFLFGLSLLIPGFQAMMEKLFARLSQLTPKSQNYTGFMGGLFIGFSLGLLWTPCVGPILASVISLAITGSVTSTAFFITLAYSLGTAIPMLMIIHGGRTLLTKVPWLLNNTGKIQKGFGVIMILTAIAIHFNLDRQFQTYILEVFPQYGTGLTSFEDNQLIRDQLDNLNSGDQSSTDNQLRLAGQPSFVADADQGVVAPDIKSQGEWFNSEPLSLADLRGQVVLIDFWTYSCINCIRTLPYLKTWHDKYSDQGLVIIGVHAPEFEFEKSATNVAQAIADFELEYPVVQDNDFLTWRAYNNRYWPAKYLIDKSGRIRYQHFGEGKYNQTEQAIQELLSETGADVSSTTIDNPDYQISSRTPETYLGYLRLDSLSSPEGLTKDRLTSYTLPTNLATNTYALEGDWTITPEHSLSTAGAKLHINFESKQVFFGSHTYTG